MITISPACLKTRSEDLRHLNTAARCVSLALGRLRFEPTKNNATAIAHGEEVLAAIGAMQEAVARGI
tara:strand:+ start:5365 stop:5565 length:201 start_codon:yes stop_codon:yes gene_type:complete